MLTEVILAVHAPVGAGGVVVAVGVGVLVDVGVGVDVAVGVGVGVGSVVVPPKVIFSVPSEAKDQPERPGVRASTREPFEPDQNWLRPCRVADDPVGRPAVSRRRCRGTPTCRRRS